jgi:PAS domain S-box-containing protein
MDYSEITNELLLKLHSAVESSGEAIFITDINGLISYINPEFTNLYGYTADEVIGKVTPRILKSGMMNPYNYENFWATILNKERVRGEHINKTKDGRLLTVEGSATPILDDRKEIVGFIGIQHDITERKRVELESQLLYEISQSMTTSSNLDELLKLIHLSLGKVIYAENCFIALHDKKTGQFSFPYFVDKFDTAPLPFNMGKSCSAYVFRTVKPLILTQQIFDELTSRNEVELVGSNSPSWIGIPLLTPSEVIGVLVLQHYELENVYSEADVKFLMSIGSQIAFAIDRKKAETALRESEKDLNESQKITGLGSYKFDVRSGTWTSSPILDSILGIDDKYKKTVNGWLDLVHPSWRETMSDYLRKEIFEDHSRFDKEYMIIRKNDGKERWVHGLGELLFDSDKRINYMAGTIMDITQRKLSEEEIKHKNIQLQNSIAEKDRFFSILAHDLRGPLSSFVGATQIITEEIQNMDIEEIKQITLRMKTSAANIYSLLENLLEWSRLKRDGLDFIPIRLNLKEKIEECIDVLSESANKKKIKTTISVAGEIEIIADNHMFDTVIRNLVFNAIKFTHTGGTVSVTADYTNDHFIEVKVSDSGIGITPELKNKLFLLDEKTNRLGTEGEPSTGLGLLLCKEFIDKHGGKLWVESEVGKGSVFSFTIPGGKKNQG